jgi:O-methyltransferase involved in polyketide biosynthesis
MSQRGSETISPTAHYTGYVWYANGLSHPAFATREGRLLYGALRPANAASRAVGGPTLEGLLLARHRVIDHLLERAIADGRVSQVVEVAAGLSPRGWRFARRHPGALRYIEADLPGMAARKRAILAEAGDDVPGHEVREIDALAEGGPGSLAELAAALDPARGVAIITEGLINYFDVEKVAGMWRRFAEVLGRFPHGLYLSDLHIGDETRGPFIGLFQAVLGAFVRGRIHVPFHGPDDAGRALAAAGFGEAALHRPIDLAPEVGEVEAGGGSRVRIVEARPRLERGGAN